MIILADVGAPLLPIQGIFMRLALVSIILAVGMVLMNVGKNVNERHADRQRRQSTLRGIADMWKLTLILNALLMGVFGLGSASSQIKLHHAFVQYPHASQGVSLPAISALAVNGSFAPSAPPKPPPFRRTDR